jgi:hypothetical protein
VTVEELQAPLAAPMEGIKGKTWTVMLLQLLQVASRALRLQNKQISSKLGNGNSLMTCR